MYRKLLKNTIIIYWVCLACLLLSGVLALPKSLELYLEEYYEQDLSIILIQFALMILSVIASIGIYRMKGWGVNLFVGATAITLVITPFGPPIVMHGLSYIFDSIHSASVGVVIVLVYFTDAIGGAKGDDP